MKDSIKNRKKKFLALCLSAMMLSSVAALAACKENTSADSSSSSSSSSAATSEVKDDGLIKNAGFETFNENNAMNTSVTGWTRSTNSSASGSALSSKAASGIIDLETDAWKNLTGTAYTAKDAADAKAHWDEMTVKDKLAFYDKWKKENSGKTISNELDFYESFNIDSGDIPNIAHFDTHDKAVANEGDDTKVLMIHNEYPEADSTATYKALGTAQKFTSSSTVTVKAGTSAEFSVWVKTLDLQSSASSGAAQDAVGKGAYISVTHSVGGTTLDAYKVENINTETMSLADTNGWKQYTFYLRGSSYTDTTFSLVLGLGQGGGTYRGEYVNGYAFFDDIECNVISNADFDSKTADVSYIAGFGDTATQKEVDVSLAANADKDVFAMDFHGDFAPTSNVLDSVNVKDTTSKNGDKDFTSLAGEGNAVAPWLNDGKGLDGSKDVVGVFDDVKTAATGNAYLDRVYADYFEGNSFSTAKKTLLMLSTKGVAYTAESTYAFNFDAGDYLAISFFVKTSDMAGFTGAGATLVDGKNKTSISSIDTTNITPVKVGDNEDVYEGWQQCFFFVKNDVEEGEPNPTFTLSFNFGPTAIEEGTKYHEGFAAFTDFQVRNMTEEEYESAQENTYAKVVAVNGGKTATSESSSKFDSAKGTPVDALETGLAQLQNYKAVYSDSVYVTGAGNVYESVNANAGLISKEYFTATDSKYFSKTDLAWLNGVKGLSTSTTAEAIWSDVFGNASQPLLIWDDGSASDKSFGYLGKSTQIAANTYTAVSVRVKVGGGNAYIYLIDTDDNNYEGAPKAYGQSLSIGRNLTYWYDDDGNICTGDPEEPATQIAFKLQPNGLYKANAKWDGYKNLTDAQKKASFANLKAYTSTNANGDLLVANSGASHDYSDYWNNDGVDGIAFYNKNGKFYADSKHKTEVICLSTVSGLAHRYEATTENKTLMTTVADTAGEFATVTFYIHTGDIAKNYRLEIWNGERTGSATRANYVIVDVNTPPSDETTIKGLLEEYDETIADDSADKIKSVFSYFDTANHLRYDETLDENNVGNRYEDNYTPSAQEEGIAYLKYVEGNDQTVFADYAYSEKAVTASAEDSDTDNSADTDDTVDTDTNPLLLASSLAIAGVLLLAVASILIRKVIVKNRKHRATNVNNKKNK